MTPDPSEIHDLLRQPLWQGPHHPSWPPEQNSWVMWVMPEFVKLGVVVEHRGISLKVHFEAHPEPTAIPDAYQYWDPYAQNYRRRDGGIKPYTICPADEPRYRINGPVEPIRADDEYVTVRQAAAFLGTTGKDVRRMLRAGQLRGRRDATWVVAADSLSERRSRIITG